MLWCKYSPGLPYSSLWFELRSRSISSLCHPQMHFLLVPDSNFQQNSIQKHQVITSKEEIFHFLFLSMTNCRFFCLFSSLSHLSMLFAKRSAGVKVCFYTLLIQSPLTFCFAGANSWSLLTAETKHLQLSSQMPSIKDISSHSPFVVYHAWHNKWALTPCRGSSASYHKWSQG